MSQWAHGELIGSRREAQLHQLEETHLVDDSTVFLFFTAASFTNVLHKCWGLSAVIYKDKCRSNVAAQMRS